MAPIFVHESKEAFLEEGLELTILETTGEQQECCICLKPIYKAECDGNAATHHHGSCSSEPKSEANPASSPVDDIPEIRIKIRACGHEIGHQCAMAFFESSVYGQCPLCRVKLFPTDKDWEDEHMAWAMEQIERGVEPLSEEEEESLRALNERVAHWWC